MYLISSHTMILSSHYISDLNQWGPGLKVTCELEVGRLFGDDNCDDSDPHDQRLPRLTEVPLPLPPGARVPRVLPPRSDWFMAG